MLQRMLIGFVFAFAWLGLTPSLQAQELPVVQGVLFHSPTCPHCIFVIDDVLPPLQAAYGAQLNIVLVNTQSVVGNRVFQNALTDFGVDAERRGVPLLIVGDAVMVGSGEIPELLPILIERGAELGGVGLPDVSGLSDYLFSSESSLGDGERSEAFGLAWAVLLFLIIALGYAGWRVWRFRPKWQQLAPIDSNNIIILSLIGLMIAGYLSYIEFTASDAICGTIGSCNTVQQSEWAKLLGIPIAFYGLVAYVAVALSWFVQKQQPRPLATLIIISSATLASIFSLYLTSLELFMIRAVCLWCIGSAIVSGLLLLITSHMTIVAPKKLRGRPYSKQRKAFR